MRTPAQAQAAYDQRMAREGKAKPKPKPYRDMRETDEFQPAVIELAERCGWRVHHVGGDISKGTRSATGKGFGDLLMVRSAKGCPELLSARPRLLYVELKSAKGVLTPDQQAWMADMRAVEAINRTVECYIWRPAQWFDGTIEEALR